MENDLFAEAYAKEVVSVVKKTIRCLATVTRGSKFYLVLVLAYNISITINYVLASFLNRVVTLNCKSLVCIKFIIRIFIALNYLKLWMQRLLRQFLIIVFAKLKESQAQ